MSDRTALLIYIYVGASVAFIAGLFASDIFNADIKAKLGIIVAIIAIIMTFFLRDRYEKILNKLK